jgi:hypothetical protein
MRLLLTPVLLVLLSGLASAASEHLMAAKIKNPHPDTVWIIGQDSAQQLEINEINGPLPKDTRVGLFSYGWFRDRLIYSTEFEELKSAGFKWQFPNNLKLKDGQYVVKVYRKRHGWFKKVFGTSLSFQVLSAGTQTDKLGYVDKIVPYSLNKDSSMLFQVQLADLFKSTENLELEFSVLDADTTRPIEGIEKVFLRKASGKLLDEVSVSAKNVFVIELPLTFDGQQVRAVYIEVRTRQKRRFRRDKPLLIYRVSLYYVRVI